MKIVALGGCINKQKDLPPHLHYHYLLGQMLDQRLEPRVDISTETYYNYFDLSDQIKSIVKQKPDAIILFVRAFPLHPLIKPLIRYKTNHERVRTMLHPYFLRTNTNRLKGTMNDHREPSEKPKRGIMHKLFARVNISAGKILTIDKWALAYIADELLYIYKLCFQANVKLILAGPPRYPAYEPLDQFCIQLNARIRELSAIHSIPHAEISVTADESGNSTFELNGYHMSSTGHELLATSIFKQFPQC